MRRAAILFALLASCASVPESAPAPKIEGPDCNVREGLKSVQDEFDRLADRPRAILLLSPT